MRRSGRPNGLCYDLVKMLRKVKITKKILFLSVGLIVIAAATILIASLRNGNTSAADSYSVRLKAIKGSVAEINRLNKEEDPASKENIDAYESALLDSVASCRNLDILIRETSSANPSPELKDASSQAGKFCEDYVKVSDYARRLSKSTRQFILYPENNLGSDASRPAGGGLQDMDEIIGYTVSDLTKLKSDPLGDPALDEYITTLSSLRNEIKRTKTDPAITAGRIRSDFARQKSYFSSGKQYYWNNTIKITSIQKALDKLLAQFEAID